MCSIGICTVSIGLAWKRRKKSRFISLTADMIVGQTLVLRQQAMQVHIVPLLDA